MAACPERPLLVEKWDGHEPLRHVARGLRRILGEARVLADVLEDERLARHQHPARNPRARRKAGADEAVRALPRDRLEDELVPLLVEEEDGGRACVEDRPGDLDDRAQELPMALLGSQDAGGDRGPQVVSGHRDPIMFVAVR
jgi:hypothetical protein